MQVRHGLTSRRVVIDRDIERIGVKFLFAATLRFFEQIEKPVPLVVARIEQSCDVSSQSNLRLC